MKRSIELTVVVAVLLLLGFATSTSAQIRVGVNVAPPRIKPGVGTVFVPESSKTKPGDAGVRAHSNVRVFIPNGLKPQLAPQYSLWGFETPASLACVYQLVTVTPGCNPTVVTSVPTGGSNAIAVVVAYDDPWAGPDLAYFSDQFGIPFVDSQFQVVYATGVQPTQDLSGGWALETSLDIEYAHAMAPKANIYLVEAASESLTDLGLAVTVAGNLIQCGASSCPSGGTGTGEVIMSWGTDEFNTPIPETAFDTYFTTPGVVYFSAAGDEPGVLYPCASPNVVCSGGTTLARNPSTGNFLYEVSWPDAGGGVSAYEPRPSYQATVTNLGPTTFRGTPDVSFDSDPYTGVWIWDSFGFQYFNETIAGWIPVGGTSVADVAWAGIVNAAGNFYPSSPSELTTMYGNRTNPSDFHDITVGYCGPYDGYTTLTHYDLCTGIGSDVGYIGK